jgi:D-sedoheptulose 7-phosphate isomerase
LKILNKDSQAILENYMEELNSAYANFPSVKILELAKIVLEASERNVVYVVGNGGSATTASHMATDLGVGSLRRSNPVRCISLVDNPGVLTATSNDLDFSSVFSQQIKLLGRRGDALLCFSASGNSVNLINAVEEAKKLGVLTVGITGFDGGRLKDLCDISIHTPTKVGSYGVVEDIHSTVSHVLTEVIRNS